MTQQTENDKVAEKIVENVTDADTAQSDEGELVDYPEEDNINDVGAKKPVADTEYNHEDTEEELEITLSMGQDASNPEITVDFHDLVKMVQSELSEKTGEPIYIVKVDSEIMCYASTDKLARKLVKSFAKKLLEEKETTDSFGLSRYDTDQVDQNTVRVISRSNLCVFGQYDRTENLVQCMQVEGYSG